MWHSSNARSSPRLIILSDTADGCQFLHKLVLATMIYILYNLMGLQTQMYKPCTSWLQHGLQWDCEPEAIYQLRFSQPTHSITITAFRICRLSAHDHFERPGLPPRAPLRVRSRLLAVLGTEAAVILIVVHSCSV